VLSGKKFPDPQDSLLAKVESKELRILKIRFENKKFFFV
jgi:hypothetical protein